MSLYFHLTGVLLRRGRYTGRSQLCDNGARDENDTSPASPLCLAVLWVICCPLGLVVFLSTWIQCHLTTHSLLSYAHGLLVPSGFFSTHLATRIMVNCRAAGYSFLACPHSRPYLLLGRPLSALSSSIHLSYIITAPVPTCSICRETGLLSLSLLSSLKN